MREDSYRPVSGRQRLWIAVLAVATAATVLLSLIYRPGGVKRSAAVVAPDKALCASGQSTGCVGGVAEVIVVPPRAASAVLTPQ
jgi:hypothetical protein